MITLQLLEPLCTLKTVSLAPFLLIGRSAQFHGLQVDELMF
uniref:Uncharacterized protein n=1 Tax=Anguilla anguilla TaxID=7936 RepID=A0A0E9VAL9_ANGAN